MVKVSPTSEMGRSRTAPRSMSDASKSTCRCGFARISKMRVAGASTLRDTWSGLPSAMVQSFPSLCARILHLPYERIRRVHTVGCCRRRGRSHLSETHVLTDASVPLCSAVSKVEHAPEVPAYVGGGNAASFGRPVGRESPQTLFR